MNTVKGSKPTAMWRSQVHRVSAPRGRVDLSQHPWAFLSTRGHCDFTWIHFFASLQAIGSGQRKRVIKTRLGLILLIFWKLETIS